MRYEFPTLTKDQISVKVKQVSKSGAVALLYKSARVDMDMLDSVVGQDNWECDYKEIHGNLYCGIGIKTADGWVWKWDCGIESAQSDGNEKKAEASDAFKRAGFRWGIGRELYSSPFVFLNVATEKDGTRYKLSDPFAKFSVSRIEYEDRRIVALTVVNSKTGEIVFDTSRSTRSSAVKPNGGEAVAPPVRRQSSATVEKLDKLPEKSAPQMATDEQRATLMQAMNDAQKVATLAMYGEKLEKLTFKNAKTLLARCGVESA